MSASFSEAEVLELAARAAEVAGRDLSQYRPPLAARDEDGWCVFYDGKRAAPGNHFSVEIDDDTGATRVVAGR